MGKSKQEEKMEQRQGSEEEKEMEPQEEVKGEEIKKEEIKINMVKSAHLKLEEASVKQEEDMVVANRILVCDICAEESEYYRMVKLFACHHIFC